MITTVAELLDASRDEREATWALPTRRVRRVYERRLARLFGDRPIGDVTTRDVDGLYRLLLAGDDHERALAAGTVQLHHQLLRQAFAYAEHAGMIAKSPVSAARSPRRRVDVRIGLDRSALKAFVAEIPPTCTLGMYARIAMLTGATRGEITALQWRHVDLDARTIRFEQRLADSGSDDRTPHRAPAHTRRTISISISITLTQLLERWLDASGSPRHPEAFVLSPTEDGRTPYRPASLTTSWRSWRQHRGNGRYQHLELRDTTRFAVLELIASEVPVTHAAAHLGHISALTLVLRYSHATPPHDEQAVTVLAGLLD